MWDKSLIREFARYLLDDMEKQKADFDEEMAAISVSMTLSGIVIFDDAMLDRLTDTLKERRQKRWDDMDAADEEVRKIIAGEA